MEHFRSFDAALTLGYATKLSNDWGLGFNFRIIHSRLSDQSVGEEQGSGVATSVSFDIASMWRPEKFVFPLIDEDIGGKFSIGCKLKQSWSKNLLHRSRLRQILFQQTLDLVLHTK